jgi:hypothetical protein
MILEHEAEQIVRAVEPSIRKRARAGQANWSQLTWSQRLAFCQAEMKEAGSSPAQLVSVVSPFRSELVSVDVVPADSPTGLSAAAADAAAASTWDTAAQVEAKALERRQAAERRKAERQVRFQIARFCIH